MNEIKVFDIDNNNIIVIVGENNKGGQDFKKTFNDCVYESEYELFPYIVGTDAYGEESMKGNVLHLSIKDWDNIEYVHCSIDENILLSLKKDKGFLLLILPEQLLSENIKETLYGKDLNEIEKWLHDMETKYNLEECLEGYIMCFYTEEDKEKIKNEDFDSL